jgi:hypothetical protein
MKISIGLSAILSFGTVALGAFPSQAAFTDCLTGTDKASGLISDLPSSCLVGDKRYFDFSTDIATDTFITIAEVGPTGKQHNLILSNAPIGGTFFNYKIEVVGSTNYLLTWQSDAAGAIAPNNYTVEVDFSNSTGGPITLDNDSPESGLISFSGGPTTTSVTHTFTNSDTLGALTDTVTQGPPDPVPAPLPILGSAAVFGSIQRLRRGSQRLKQLVVKS